MLRTLTFVSLLNFVLPAISSPCAVFDAKFNLYAFGLGGKDWNAGPQDSWGSGTYLTGIASYIRPLNVLAHSNFHAGSATDVTASGRP